MLSDAQIAARDLTVNDITPELLRTHVWFTPTRLRRGYDEDEVDNLLDLLADRLEAVLRENNELRVRMEQTEDARG